MMSAPMVRTYLRSPVLLGAAVAVVTAGQGIVMVALRSQDWAGHWPSSSAALGSATLFGAAVSAAAAAWVVATPRRRRYQDLLASSSRSMAGVYLWGLLAVAVGNLIGYAAVAGYLVSVTAPQATRGQLDLVELLPVLGAVPAALGAGALIGRLLPATLASVVAAAMSYVAYALATYIDAYLGRLLLADLLAFNVTARDYLRAPPALLILKGVLATAFGLALLAWVVRTPRVAYAASLITGLSLSGALLIGGARVEVPEEYRAVCLDGGPTVCVDQAHDHLLPRYQEQVRAELAKVPGLGLSGAVFVATPELLRFSEERAGTGPDLAPQVRVLVAPVIKGDSGFSHEIDRRQFTAAFGERLFRQSCPPGAGEGGDLAIVLYHWWLTESGLPTDGSNFAGEPPTRLSIQAEPRLRELASWFDGLTDQQRQGWFFAHAEEVLSCSATRPAGTGQR